MIICFMFSSKNFCIDHQINTSTESDLAFIPFDPPLENKMYLVWKY